MPARTARASTAEKTSLEKHSFCFKLRSQAAKATVTAAKCCTDFPGLKLFKGGGVWRGAEGWNNLTDSSRDEGSLARQRQLLSLAQLRQLAWLAAASSSSSSSRLAPAAL